MTKISMPVLLGVLMVACAGKPRPADDLVFLTREGCVQTDQMRERLDAALVKAGWPRDYDVIDLAAIPQDDPRSGYPTPTVLYRGHDLYGMPTPTPPFPEPT